MPTYITLVNYTQHGIQNMAESPERLEAAKEVTEAHGGEYVGFYLTFGQYDAVYIAEFPDDEAAAQAMLTVAAGGAVETETLKAFTEDEYRDVVAGLD
ncbi:GYD domain-containing protein [Halorarius halobius]|uniref:GYD domain-containing protein n=1 Tax=Halorarius halobius TaxID=2962671 RepID=UPI0020CE06CF|nr:GYD domain-containing protein [Halorarius halobius]